MAFEVLILVVFALVGVFILKLLMAPETPPQGPAYPPPPYSPYMAPPPMPYGSYYPVKPKPVKKKIIIVPESTVRRKRKSIRRRHV